MRKKILKQKSIGLEPEQVERLEDLAEHEGGMTFSKFIRVIVVKEFLEKEGDTYRNIKKGGY